MGIGQDSMFGGVRDMKQFQAIRIWFQIFPMILEADMVIDIMGHMMRILMLLLRGVYSELHLQHHGKQIT